MTSLGLLSCFFFVVAALVAGDDDASCLMGLKASLDEDGTNEKLKEWTRSSLANPCSKPSVSVLPGITCSSNRVFSILLSSYDIAGTLSPSIANCSDLQTLDLSSNSISGPIPNSMGNLSNLVTLNLSSNLFSNSIPVELSDCLYLNIIDLHRNQLSDSIPGQLGLLTRLKVLDVSNNKLSGQIPSSLSMTATGAPRFNASSFQNNKGLYGYPLGEHTSHGLSVLAIVGIGLGSGVLSLVVSSLAVCIWLRVSEQGYAAQEGKITQLVTDS
ncbi:hypothetical protein L7F22_002509 [Adiantum nelumboides]|nr:hypothetical protein [Adiantum nelumboides]